MILIRLDGVPRAKGRGRAVANKAGHVRIYSHQRTVVYEGKLGWAAQMVMKNRPLLDEALVVEVEAYMPLPASKPIKWKLQALAGDVRPTGKPDWDNFGKILDALNGVVWRDDSLIVHGSVKKFYSERPRLEIRIDNLSETLV